MKSNALVVAIASLLVGGVATAAYYNNRDDGAKRVPDAHADLARPAIAQPLGDEARLAQAATDERQAQIVRPAYADVIRVAPVVHSQKRYGTVLDTEPVRETIASSAPREVCEDVAVQERLPERDGNVGGTAVGAVIGGLVGNQVGKGDGRKAATVAGAVAGGFIGNRVDRRHEGGRVVARTERQCHTVSETTTTSRITAWNVTYRTPEGRTEHMRAEAKPGSRIPLGTERTVVGYDVTYRYDGREGRVRTARDPGDRLPVVDGEVVVRASDSVPTRG